MKRLILLAFALQCATAFAQWEQTSGPYGGSIIKSIISDPLTGTIYAGGLYSGVFSSDDGGESWVDISNGLTELTIRSLVITPDGDLFTTGWYGIARLQAGEEAWEMLENELSELPVAALTVNSQNDLFAIVFNMDGTEAAGVYRSLDNGVSWSLMLSATTSLEEDITLAVDDTDKVYFGATAGAFRSDDNGVTWIDISPFNGYYNVTSFAFGAGGALFAGTNYMGGIFRSYDDGATWENVHDLIDLAHIMDIEVNENNEIFASNGSSVLKSEDGGNTWNILVEDIGMPQSKVYDLLVVGQDTLLAAEYNLYRSDDNGISFSEASEGMIGTSVNSVAIGADSRIYATTFYKLWVMDYQEEVWEDISYNFPVLYGFKNVKNYPQGLFVIADRALYMSVDNGATWEVASMLGEAIPADTYGVNNLGYIYIANDHYYSNGVYRSTDGGATYELLDLEIDNQVNMEINQNGTILIYEQFEGFHRSTDNGDTWEFIDFYNSVLSMETGDSGVFYVTGYGVWRSEDDGLTWQEITPEEGGENIEYKAIHKHPNGDLFLSSQEAVYISTDEGLTWNDYYTASATPLGFISFASDPSLPWLFAGHSGRGLWKASTVTGTVTVTPDAGSNQIYPNPATHSITLQVDNYNKTTAPIMIYNSSSRLVKQLPASSARMEIDISSLSTGIYYVVYNGKGLKFVKE